MRKGESDRGVRTRESGVEDKRPLEDSQAGDEGLSDGGFPSPSRTPAPGATADAPQRGMTGDEQ